MNYRRIQQLRIMHKQKVVSWLAKEREVVALEGAISIDEKKALLAMDSLALAYLGDAYYSMYVRTVMVQSGVTKVRYAHELVTAVISAKGQAQAFLALETQLREEERQVANKARNANLSVPKSATVWEYRLSTCLEAVLGFLYMTHDKSRLDELCHMAFVKSAEAWRG